MLINGSAVRFLLPLVGWDGGLATSRSLLDLGGLPLLPLLARGGLELALAGIAAAFAVTIDCRSLLEGDTLVFAMVPEFVSFYLGKFYFRFTNACMRGSSRAKTKMEEIE